MENRKDWKVKSGYNVSYPEKLKIKVVKEIEHGLISKEYARRKYGIRGKTTVLSWCRKYGRKEYAYMDKQNKRKFQSIDDKDKRIAELEAQLVQKQLAVDALEALIEVANEMYGTDLKKKVGLRQLKK